MNKIYQIQVISELDVNFNNHTDKDDFSHPFFKDLALIIGEENSKNIGFNNSESMFVKLSDFNLKQVEMVMKKYFIIEVEDITEKVISGEIQKLYPEVEKLTPKLFKNFRLENTSIDDILDKINENGLSSLDKIDKKILRKK